MTESTSKVRLNDFDPSIGLDRGASKLKELCWYVIKVIFFLSALPYPSSLKVWLLKLFGAKVGKGLVLKPRVNIHFPWKLEVGDHVWIGEEAFLLNFEKLTIGHNVCISQRAFLCGGNHDYRNPAMPYRNGPITLKNGVWVGACCFIGPNVTIGSDSVITVGSVIISKQEGNKVITQPITPKSKDRWR
ncbi:WcaF family extracellular polysaccharide biosynthesis acetyltransferase [Zobellia galactanivorans]|uniref:WcaF family extracellular polysaccharide biosynthesis acetyltransferase n=1 Tax=Zobellia galactanivorans (strain DSM 12802 / CCUG 47099 / CIP 106680 / NCIMB 13871 / Dsij) TaxID=63186 RepID=UPI001C066FDF|nr:WcaF family extracellular polysaccharide biosynthesis acetyltransferase [Zobellia galactanivorans]MBU3028344.1 WcaF family extracellular polysaccharide biosynthesis acetyltransferase [Zobellia galactanivorans]